MKDFWKRSSRNSTISIYLSKTPQYLFKFNTRFIKVSFSTTRDF